MINYIIPIVVVLILFTIYKLTKKDKIPKIKDPFDGPIQKQSKKFHDGDNLDMSLAHDAYKERKEIETRVINDHIAEIMNIKKKK